MKIQLKRSNALEDASAKMPSSAQMEYGELAVNYNASDTCIFVKDSNDQIVRIAGLGSVGIPGGYPDLEDGNGITLDERYVRTIGDNMTGNLTLGTDNITLDATSGSAGFTGSVETTGATSLFSVNRTIAAEGESLYLGYFNGIEQFKVGVDGSGLFTGKVKAGETEETDPSNTVVTKGYLESFDGGNLTGEFVRVAGDDMTGNLTLGTDKIILRADNGSAEFKGSITLPGGGGDTEALQKQEITALIAEVSPEPDFTPYVKKAGDVMTGQLALPGGGGATEALQKQEVESLISVIDLTSYVEKSGDTMTGLLGLPGGGGPTDALQKQEIEALIPVIDLTPYVEKSGDTMTGPLVLWGDPASADQAANKRYVDDVAANAVVDSDAKYVEVSGDNMTGDLTLGTDKILLQADTGNVIVDGFVRANGNVEGIVSEMNNGTIKTTIKDGNTQILFVGIKGATPVFYVEYDGSITAAGDVTCGGKVTSAETLETDSTNTLVTKGYIDNLPPGNLIYDGTSGAPPAADYDEGTFWYDSSALDSGLYVLYDDQLEPDVGKKWISVGGTGSGGGGSSSIIVFDGTAGPPESYLYKEGQLWFDSAESEGKLYVNYDDPSPEQGLKWIAIGGGASGPAPATTPAAIIYDGSSGPPSVLEWAKGTLWYDSSATEGGLYVLYEDESPAKGKKWVSVAGTLSAGTSGGGSGALIYDGTNGPPDPNGYSSGTMWYDSSDKEGSLYVLYYDGSPAGGNKWIAVNPQAGAAMDLQAVTDAGNLTTNSIRCGAIRPTSYSMAHLPEL